MHLLDNLLFYLTKTVIYNKIILLIVFIGDSMDWTEICITVKNEFATLAADICNMTLRSGIYIEDYSDLEQGALEIAHIDLIDEDLLRKDRTVSIIHLYFSSEDNISEALSYLEPTLKAAGIEYKLDKSAVKEADWADNWKKYFKVTEIGNRLVICPSWEEYANGDKAVIKIDPGAAFGTGTHATTSLCLELLEKYTKNGVSVLDIGCGSGILSIASCLLGAENAVGVDIDPTSVRVAKENALINSVDTKTEYIVGDLAEKVCGEFDIVCANIVADIIIKLNRDIKKYMKKDAVYITSGIIDIRADEVKESFAKSGLSIIEELRRDNWYAFALKF